jgi:uncharacterized protein YmfQ (DUF2313 family)
VQTINYLPTVLQEIKELKVLTTCEDFVLDELDISTEGLYKDQFIKLTEKAIPRYEKMLGIISKGGESLEDRRFRILASYNKQPPYTKRVLENNLITFCKENGYKLIIDKVNSVLTVKISITAKSMFETVRAYLDEVVPLNLMIEMELLYNQYKLLQSYTHAHLSQYTYFQLREEVIV